MGPSVGLNLRVTGHCSQGGRKYMEDAFVVAYQQSEDGKDLEYAYFGIFDGHGGVEAALYAKEHLMNNIACQKNFWSDDDQMVLKAIRDGFLITHRAMWKEVGKWPKTVSGLPSTSGTTSSIAFIRKRKLYIGHVGDSKIVIGYQEPGNDEWGSLSLTKDHKPETPKERQRIYSAGGLVMNKAGVERVVWNRPRPGHRGPVRRSTPFDQIPFLAVARSLGDLWSFNYLHKEFVVSPDPDVCVFNLDPRRDRCIILGSDGLWNMLTKKSAVKIVQKAEEENEHMILEGGGSHGVGKPANNPSKLLVDRALTHWFDLGMRADNTSVVTVMLDPPGPPRCEVLLRQKVLQKLRPRDEQLDSNTSLSGENTSDRKSVSEKCAEMTYWSTEPHCRALAEACKYGDTIQVKRFLDDGADVNEVVEGRSLLTIASSFGHYEIVELLLSRKARMVDKGANVLTPMMEAAEAGHVKIVKLLVQHGAGLGDKIIEGDDDADFEARDSSKGTSASPSSDSSAIKDTRKSIENCDPQTSKDKRKASCVDETLPSKVRKISCPATEDVQPLRCLPKPVVLFAQRITKKSQKPFINTPPTNADTAKADRLLVSLPNEVMGDSGTSKTPEDNVASNEENSCKNMLIEPRCSVSSNDLNASTSNSRDTQSQKKSDVVPLHDDGVREKTPVVSPSVVSLKSTNGSTNCRTHLCEVDNIVKLKYCERRMAKPARRLSKEVQDIERTRLCKATYAKRSLVCRTALRPKRNLGELSKSKRMLKKARLHRSCTIRSVSLQRDFTHNTRAQNRIRKMKV